VAISNASVCRGVLGVLEHLLLTPGPAQKVKRRLAQRQHLAEQPLAEAKQCLQRIIPLAQLRQTLLKAVSVPARLIEMALQPIAIGAARRHRNLRLRTVTNATSLA